MSAPPSEQSTIASTPQTDHADSLRHTQSSPTRSDRPTDVGSSGSAESSDEPVYPPPPPPPPFTSTGGPTSTATSSPKKRVIFADQSGPHDPDDNTGGTAGSDPIMCTSHFTVTQVEVNGHAMSRENCLQLTLPSKFVPGSHQALQEFGTLISAMTWDNAEAAADRSTAVDRYSTWPETDSRRGLFEANARVDLGSWRPLDDDGPTASLNYEPVLFVTNRDGSHEYVPLGNSQVVSIRLRASHPSGPSTGYTNGTSGRHHSSQLAPPPPRARPQVPPQDRQALARSAVSADTDSLAASSVVASDQTSSLAQDEEVEDDIDLPSSREDHESSEGQSAPPRTLPTAGRLED